jgi:aminoglycoside phosphotransferase (APT) family kinase protein
VTNRLERLFHYTEKARVLSTRELGAARARLEHILAASAPVVSPTLVHRDLCLKNVLIDEHGKFTALLDFEHARLSDPLMDFAKLKLWLFDREAGAQDAFFSGYRSVLQAGWPEEGLRTELAVALELLGQVPYYKRNGASEKLDEATSLLRAWLERSASSR